MSEFKFACTHCGQHLQGETTYAGQRLRCPACQKEFTVPALEGLPVALPAPAQPVPIAVPVAVPVAVPAAQASSSPPPPPPSAPPAAPPTPPAPPMPPPSPMRSMPPLPPGSASGKTSPLAITSLILSLLTVVLGPLGFIPGIICGHLAKSRIKRQPGLKGRGLATAGLAIGYTFLGLFVVGLVFFLTAFNAMVREVEQQQAERLPQFTVGGTNQGRAARVPSAPVESPAPIENAAPGPETSAPEKPVSAENDAGAVTRDFLAALRQGDLTAAERGLSREARPGSVRDLLTYLQRGRMLQADSQITVESSAAPPGEIATVKVAVRNAQTSEALEVILRREEGSWRVRRMRWPEQAKPLGFEFDFARHASVRQAVQEIEQKLVQWQSGSAAAGAEGDTNRPVRAVESVTMSQYLQSWQTSVNVANQPARQVLEQLARRWGVVINTSGVPMAMGKPVTLQLQNRSRVEILEALCRQVDCHPAYGPLEIRLEPGLRPYPVALAGPFMLEMRQWERSVGSGTGQLRLALHGMGLPSGVVAALRQAERRPVPRQILGSNGRDLLDTRAELTARVFDESTNYTWEAAVPLKNLTRDLTAIRALTVTFRVPVPRQVERVQFTALEAGQSQKVGDLRLTLREVTKSTTIFESQQRPSANLWFEWSGAEPIDVVFTARDMNRRLMRALTSKSGANRRLVQVIGMPALIEATIVMAVDPVDYTLSLQDVAVPVDLTAPAALPPAQYAGAEPVKVTVTGFTNQQGNRKVRFLASNLADKAVRQIEVLFSYYDPANRRLGTYPYVQGREPHLVPKEGELELTASLRMIPFDTAHVRAELIAVVFGDGEEWRRPVQTPN